MILLTWHSILTISKNGWFSMSTKIDSPFYMRLSMNLISLSIIAAIIYLGRSILTPIFLSGLLAMLLHPFVSVLTERKINRVLAITICIVLSVCVIAIIVYFLSTQIGHFLDDMPAMKERLREVSM